MFFVKFIKNHYIPHTTNKLKMENSIKILIVEDEMIIGANISLQLSELGYDVVGIVPRGEEALIHMKQNKPDIVLLDIQLKGELDGIETAKRMQENNDIPIIYLTANTDEHYFARAKETNPYAFISKPFKKIDLQRAIELTVSRMMINYEEDAIQKDNCISPYVLSDSIFVKRNEKMIKILIEDIYYFEADRNYCKIYSKSRDCLLVMTLKNIDDKLPKDQFLRIHRSYIVNLSHVDEVGGSHVVVMKKAIPLSKALRGKLLDRLQTF